MQALAAVRPGYAPCMSRSPAAHQLALPLRCPERFLLSRPGTASRSFGPCCRHSITASALHAQEQKMRSLSWPAEVRMQQKWRRISSSQVRIAIEVIWLSPILKRSALNM